MGLLGSRYIYIYIYTYLFPYLFNFIYIYNLYFFNWRDISSTGPFRKLGHRLYTQLCHELECDISMHFLFSCGLKKSEEIIKKLMCIIYVYIYLGGF